MLGAAEQKRSTGALFNLIVDRVVQEAPCATMIVKSNLPMPKDNPITYQPIRHILVPTVGTEYSKNAVEGRVFFGHLVDAILRKASCPVAVVTST